MIDAVRIGRIPRPWFTFTGCALAIAILYWAQMVLVPLAFAVLLAFVLAPLVSALQGRIGRVAAVLTVVTLTCTALGLVGWLVTQQLASIAGEIPGYQQNIHQKIRDIRNGPTAFPPLRRDSNLAAAAAAPSEPAEPAKGLRRFVLPLGPQHCELTW